MRSFLLIAFCTLSTILFAQTGKIGIGTDTPMSILDIAATGDDAELLRLSTEHPWLFKQIGSGSAAGLALQSTVNSKSFTILSQNGSTRVAEFVADNNTSKVKLVPDHGYVGIGVEDPTAPLEIFSDHGPLGLDTALIARTVVETPDEFDQTIAIYGHATASSAIGVMGHTTNPGGFGIGIYGYSNGAAGYGLYGFSNGANATGVRGVGQATGVSGYAKKYGLKGTAQGSTYAVGYGLHGTSSTTEGVGVYGFGYRGVLGATSRSDGIAVYGSATHGTGSTEGVKGEVTSNSGYGVHGIGGLLGVYGNTSYTTGTGVRGYNNALSGTNNGVAGESLSSHGRGVYGRSSGSHAKALYGYATGIYGKGLHVEVTSTHSSANAILAESGGGSSYAGYFIGKLHVAGTLSKSMGSFKIDHPLDPENKYLYHSFVESPDMMNIYNGNVVTDSEGLAVVELPEYFEALNMVFRYQLTVIGTFARAIIAEEISENQFKIRTDEPNIKVSWQVTGVRQDPYARANRLVVEEVKEEENRGRYLNPEAYGKSETSRIGRTDSEMQR